MPYFARGPGLGALNPGDETGEALAPRRSGGQPWDQALAHHGKKLRLGHRLGEQIALPDMAAECLQFVTLMDALDAFGHDREIEALAEFAKNLAQPGIDLVDMAVADIGALDLELAEGKLAPAASRGCGR